MKNNNGKNKIQYTPHIPTDKSGGFIAKHPSLPASGGAAFSL